jgi:hypothetical protein
VAPAPVVHHNRAMPISRALLLAALTFLAACLLAPPAGAHHSATASARLTLEPLGPRCKQAENAPRSKCDGSRVARVDWSATCGADSAIIEVDYMAARPGGKRPLGLATVELDSALAGVTRKRIGAGTRVLASVTVHCDSEGDGDTIESHRVTASATTATAVIAPRLVKVEAVTNSFCGFRPTNRQTKFSAQAGETMAVDYTLEFNEQSLLGADSRKPAGLRQQRLFARGGGVRYRERPRNFVPGPVGLLRVSAGARFPVRRKGKLRFSAVIAGMRTNSLAFPVFGRRCAHRG